MSDRKQSPPGPGGMGRGPRGPVEKPKDSRKTFSRLLKYFGVRKYQIMLVGILAAFSTIFGIVGPKLQGKVTTKLFDGFIGKYMAIMNNKPMPAIDFSYIGNILLITLGLYGFSALLGYLQQYLMSDVAQKIVFDLRRDMNDKMHKLPLKYFDSRTHGEVMSRITNDIDNIANTLQQSLTQFLTSGFTILGILIMMLSISPLLTHEDIQTFPEAVRSSAEGIGRSEWPY